MQALPTTEPSTTLSQGGIRPCSIEYWKKYTPASASMIPPATAAPRTPSQRSQSICGNEADGAAGRDGGGVRFGAGLGGTGAAGVTGGCGEEIGVDGGVSVAETGIGVGGDAGFVASGGEDCSVRRRSSS